MFGKNWGGVNGKVCLQQNINDDINLFSFKINIEMNALNIQDLSFTPPKWYVCSKTLICKNYIF